MKDLFSSDRIEKDIQQMEGFLHEKFGNFGPKSGFQDSLKNRLISSEIFQKKKGLGKAWIIGFGVAVAGAAFYGMGYLIYKNALAKTV